MTQVADLERRLAATEAARTAAETARIDAETRLAAVEKARAGLERLLSQMRRDAFGAKPETHDPDQHHLPFEDVEAAAGMQAATGEASWKMVAPRKSPFPPLRRRRDNLPPHLPRIEQVIEPVSSLAPVAAARCKGLANPVMIVDCRVECAFRPPFPRAPQKRPLQIKTL